MLRYSPSSKTLALCALLAALLACRTMVSGQVRAAEASSPVSARPTVVIDPGHGGRDAGARGWAGTTEKAFTLRIAALLAAEMKKHCRVLLTRSGDYQVAAADRTTAANHNGADVFISLHTGAGFSRQISGTAVYFYRPHGQSAADRSPAPEPPGQGPVGPTPWHLAQLPHRKSSEDLARLLCSRLKSAFPHIPCIVYGAPLLPLEGAAMPAVLIEMGYLTHPSEEKRMTSAGHQTSLVAAIDAAIREFLDKSVAR